MPINRAPQSSSFHGRLAAHWLITSELWLPSALALYCVAGLANSFLLFHSLAELLSVVLALTTLVVAVTSLQFTQNHFIVFIAVAFGWCSVLDVLHLLKYQGMTVFADSGGNASTQLWVAARLLQAAALAFAPSLLGRRLSPTLMQLLFAALVAGALALIEAGWFPTTYVEGHGVTLFKSISEYLVIALLILALWRCWQQRQQLSTPLRRYLSVALLLMIASEAMFSHYVNLYGPSNVIGHVLKIYAGWFVYVALARTTLNEPFEALARAARTYDAVPDPTLIVQADGTIRQANRAAAALVGMPAEALVGRSSHALFHDALTPPENCPICQRLAQGGAFAQELANSDDTRVIECSVAELPAGDVRVARGAYVQVVRDITQRRESARERERLLADLGERVKELRTLYQVSELTNAGTLDLATLLDRVTQTLPQAFRFPQLAGVWIDGLRGQFGREPPADTPHRVAANIQVAGKTVGSVMVHYPADVVSHGDAFLADERELIETVAGQLGESIQRHADDARIRRLTYLYQLLSATHRNLVHSRDIGSLLQGLHESLTRHGAFPMLFIARSDDINQRFQVIHSHGIAAAQLPDLAAWLAEPEGTMAGMLPRLRNGELVHGPVLTQGTSVLWLRYLEQQAIRHRALVPIRQGGQLVALIVLYLQGSEHFDDEQLRLLDEVALDLGFALDSMASDALRQAAQDKAAVSEHRFQELFDSSPLPMQIMQLSDGSTRALNHAHQQLFGFALEEIPDEQAWFEKLYPDAALREATRRLWREDLQAASHVGVRRQSPELQLRGKDGRELIVRGAVTVVGDDVVVGWQDLSEIRRGEKALRDSEQRFRSMIEHTVHGVYVATIDRRVVYANPSICRMVGYTSKELLGTDVGTLMSAESRARLERFRTRLSHGEQQIVDELSLQRRDGSLIELAFRASPLQWNDQPAYIVMAEDVSERKRAQTQIDAYIEQLKLAMHGTLQAISRMVELRDPYTAGHERRVGLIARDIARELGWQEDRCQSLELIGLVHDLGKIAIPAEILSKPTRLTALEYQIVQGHVEAGYDILRDIQFAAPVAEAVRQHHERLDGSGYPRGLKDAEIIPEARILAVADVFESMSSHRPYRPARGPAAAIAELQQGRGSAYAPEAVDALLRLLAQADYRLPE